MVVGVCRVALFLPGAASLKDKRQVVRRVLDRVRGRFHVAAAEVGDQDLWQRAVLGFAAVGNEAGHVQSMLDAVVAFVGGEHAARILDRETDLQRYGAGRLAPERTLAEAWGDREDGDDP